MKKNLYQNNIIERISNSEKILVCVGLEAGCVFEQMLSKLIEVADETNLNKIKEAFSEEWCNALYLGRKAESMI